jgi:hypothetical protein
MLKGGFKMMAGTSPWGMVNVGAGGAAAAEDLGESFKDLRKAAQEQDKMEMELAKAKMDASTGNLKTAWDRTDKANQLNADRNKALVSAGATIQGANINARAGIQEALIRERGSLAAANALPANARLAMMLGTGDTEQARLSSGLKSLTTLTGDRPDLAMAKMYAEHVQKAQAAMQQPMSPQDFVKSMRSVMSAYNPTVVTDPKNRTVIQRTDGQ